MRITMLGCGTSVGVPSLGPAGWGACDATNPRNFRQRCALLVEKDGFTVLVDAGPDIRRQLLAAGVRRLDAVLITHCHSDHIAGMDDLRPYYFVEGRKIPVYATASDLAILTDKFGYLFQKHEHSPSYFKPSLEAREISPDSVLRLGGGTAAAVKDGEGDAGRDGKEGEGDAGKDGDGREGEGEAAGRDGSQRGGVEVRVVRQYHGRLDSLGFVFDGRVGYSTDVVDFPPESFQYLTGLEVWVVEMLREKPHSAHAHFELTMEWVRRCRPRRAVLTHLGLESDYETLLAKCPPGVEPGYDGLVVELGCGW